MSNAAVAPGTRDRLIAAMVDALQRRGLHGVGLTELLAQAQAPKGVLYHHFPGGKAELAVAAIDTAVDRLCRGLERLSAGHPDPTNALAAWLDGARRQLERSAFERGCPLATVALESTADDAALRAALARGFTSIRERLAVMMVAAGVAPARATALALLIVAGYEGALMQARVAGDSAPLRGTADALVGLLRSELTAVAR